MDLIDFFQPGCYKKEIDQKDKYEDLIGKMAAIISRREAHADAGRTKIRSFFNDEETVNGRSSIHLSKPDISPFSRGIFIPVAINSCLHLSFEASSFIAS